MATAHIPGAVIVIVKDGEIFLAKGYGFADQDNQIPVDGSCLTSRYGDARSGAASVTQALTTAATTDPKISTLLWGAWLPMQVGATGSAGP